MGMTTDEIERQLIEAIERISRDARQQAQPYINQLAQLRAMRPHIITRDGVEYVPFAPPEPPADPLRARLLDMLKAGTADEAGKSTLFGVALSDMTDAEIRAAALWMASRIDNLTGVIK